MGLLDEVNIARTGGGDEGDPEMTRIESSADADSHLAPRSRTTVASRVRSSDAAATLLQQHRRRNAGADSDDESVHHQILDFDGVR